MVGLFFWRIFLNFPLKSLGGNESWGELAMWLRTTSPISLVWLVSISAMSVPELSSTDMLNGRKHKGSSSDLLIESLEAATTCFTIEDVALPFVLQLKSCFEFHLRKDAANLFSVSFLMCFNLCTCQGSPATVTFMHWAGIGLLGQPLLFSAKKGNRQTGEGQSHD